MSDVIDILVGVCYFLGDGKEVDDGSSDCDFVYSKDRRFWVFF